MMKYILLFLFFGCLNSLAAQPVVKTFEAAKEAGISIMEIDKQYPSAVFVGSGKGVFDENMEKFSSSYVTMMQKMGSYMHDNGFQWKKRTQFFQRIYFSKDGTIDYYLVNLESTKWKENKKNRFIELLKNFAQKYQFPLTAESNFAQCAPIIFSDPKPSTKTDIKQ